jgi:MoaA/NifB/PqqE/SkfB family radical SAM enzyme
LAVPLIQQRLGAARLERYPLVLMLEPLFRCNLACPGAARSTIRRILNKRLRSQECLEAVDECGAPMVAIPAASR